MTLPNHDDPPPNDPSPHQPEESAAPTGPAVDPGAAPEPGATSGEAIAANGDGQPRAELPAAAPGESLAGSPSPADRETRRLFSWPTRTFCLFGGVVVPVVCLLIGFPAQPVWQSGSASDYARIMLSPSCGWPLWPFLAYNMVSLMLTLYRPERFARRFLVRWGVYSGVLTAVVYWLLFGVALVGHPIEVAGWLLGSAMAAAIGWSFGYGALTMVGAVLRGRRDQAGAIVFAVASVVLVLSLLAWLLNLLTQDATALVEVLGVVVFASLMFSTPMAVLSYAIVAFDAWRRGAAGQGPLRFTLAQLVAVLTWLAAWLGAWRTSYLLALELYVRLPVEPPDDCYVSAAAARGHRRVVGSAVVVGRDGRRRRVNDQMRLFKAAEIALRTGWPAAHRACRRLYDWIGPPLARRLRYGCLADLAYLALKPAEWAARIALAVLAPESGKWIERLYGGNDHRAARHAARDE